MSIETTIVLSRLKFMSDNLRELRRYLNINYKILFSHIQKTLILYPQYISQIADYLDKLK